MEKLSQDKVSVEEWVAKGASEALKGKPDLLYGVDPNEIVLTVVPFCLSLHPVTAVPSAVLNGLRMAATANLVRSFLQSKIRHWMGQQKIDYTKISTAKPKKGQSATPRTASEKQAWKEAWKDPAGAEQLDNCNKDPRFQQSDGWQKMEYTYQPPGNNKEIYIHYQYNFKTKQVVDMKIAPKK